METEAAMETGAATVVGEGVVADMTKEVIIKVTNKVRVSNKECVDSAAEDHSGVTIEAKSIAITTESCS